MYQLIETAADGWQLLKLYDESDSEIPFSNDANYTLVVISGRVNVFVSKSVNEPIGSRGIPLDASNDENNSFRYTHKAGNYVYLQVIRGGRASIDVVETPFNVAGSGGTAGVITFNGRQGAVTPALNDYSANKISTTNTGVTVQDELNSLNNKLGALSTVKSFFNTQLNTVTNGADNTPFVFSNIDARTKGTNIALNANGSSVEFKAGIDKTYRVDVFGDFTQTTGGTTTATLQPQYSLDNSTNWENIGTPQNVNILQNNFTRAALIADIFDLTNGATFPVGTTIYARLLVTNLVGGFDYSVKIIAEER